MQSLRISRGIEIEVNDDGEKITIPVEDMNFIDNFHKLIDKFEHISTELGEKEGRLSTKEELELVISKTEDIMNEINTLFNDNRCCLKVFGDITPSPWLLADFFDKLRPFIVNYANERNKAIAAKYSNSRRGTRK